MLLSSNNQESKDIRGGYLSRWLARNAIVILILVVVAVLALGSPVQSVIKAQKELDASNKELLMVQKQKEYVIGEANRWNDNNFVIAWSREHYGLIMPGELSMHVIDADGVGNAKDLENFTQKDYDELTASQKKFEEYKQPWYAKIAKAF